MKNMKTILALALIIVSVLAISIPALAETTKYVTARPNVNFRVSPGGALIDRIPYAASVRELSTSHVSGVQWSYVRYNGTLGYVQTQYLSTTYPGSHPTSKNQAFGTYTLQYGQTSYYVKNLQLALKHAGYLSDSADGIFGNNTYNAVVAFQTAKGLTIDGLVGNGTKSMLWNLYGSWLMINGVMTL